MGVKVLLRDRMASLDIIIEKSDSGKLFFGVSRDDPKARECYTFDAKQLPGRLLNLVRDSVVNCKDGSQRYVDFDIAVNHKKKQVDYSSRSHPEDPVQAAKEIERAYKVVDLYRGHFNGDDNKPKLYPEVAAYLDHIAVFPKDSFGESYRFDVSG